MVAFFFPHPDNINEQIKKTENKLTVLREQLNFYENFINKWPTLEDSKPGDTLKDGCIVVNKFSDTRMALIAAPVSTERYCKWSKDFNDVFDELSRKGFNKSQWFIPTVKQLQLAYRNCKEHFTATYYWSSTEASSTNSCLVNFLTGIQGTYSKSSTDCVRAFSLVSY